MGYGFGVFLGAVGLILALAVRDAISGVDLVMIGWILAAAGGVIVVLTAAQDASRRRGARAVQTTTHEDGSQTVREERTEPPA